MRYRVAIVVLALLVPLSTIGIAQERYVDVKTVLEVLQTGSLAEREATMERVVEVKAITKSAALAKAIGAELVRMNAVLTERQRRIEAGVAVPEAPATGEYLALLVQACAQSADPSVIDGLVGVIDTGWGAMRALARFGPTAFDRVLTVASSGTKPMKVSGALITLELMNQTGTLSPEHRARGADVIRTRLSGRQSSIVFSSAIRAAAASDVVDLRERVEAIASGAVLLDTSDQQDMTAELQRRAQEALKKKRM
jgi:hypothetical protein